ncbi:DUF2818 family protein [Rhizobacter sp. Root404]|jgi:Na+(H+)/acetate symporter ActP|uniref:DUF2818 family protein n=1 Tax=Rhizobacter sp. Root404 TaxID=1736528 RepID=UPI0006FB5C3D|nr:DUF2818 family protein [Rhizobacter sp. Root404]KQW36289.1 hypothetical protein ASC76_16470 [Rhizobacter sp. Root404]
MASTPAVWLVLLIALVAANLPFVNERLFVVGPAHAPKSIGWRLLELVVFWGLTLAIGFALEARAGQRQPQGWEFYAALGFTFLTFAFPGFVWRYLRRGR